MNRSTREDAISEFERGLEASFRLAANGQTIVRTLRLGERSIALHFASEAMLSGLSPALARLEPGEPATPDLTLCIWDGDSSQVTLPHPPWRAGDIGPRGDIEGFASGRFRAAFNLDSRTLCFADGALRRSFFWVASAKQLPDYELASPLRTLLAWGVEGWGWQLAHAGCIAHDERAVLLVGKGGSGKSTCALTCLSAGFEYVADDYCVLALTASGPEVHGLYATGRLDPEHLNARLPELRTRAVRGSARKATLFLDGAALRRSARPVRLEALVLPVIAGEGATALTRCSEAAALSALAPSSIFQVPGLGVSTFRFLADVVRRLPCYRLSLGTDLSQAREALFALVS